ncbi:hypothetical protein FRC17_002551 [Serendipita sp. 399]|nr:hypothetical protein FRC17_002551 [Serendipita sp. 399]
MYQTRSPDTKGSRYVLASAEESWQRIQALCVRVQDLEFALERAHAALVASNPSVAASTSGNPNIGTHSTTPSGVGGVVGAGDRHPLLDPELIKIGQDPRAVMVGKNGGSNLASSSGELVNQGLGTTGGPNDVPVAQMGTMKMSKSGSFRWMAFGDGVPEQDFEHAVSPDQYPDHPHSHSHQRQGSFSSASFPFSAGGENPDGTSVLPPVSGTTLNAGAQFGSSSSTTGSFGSAPFTPTIAGPLAFGSVYELKMYAIRQLPSSQQALHMIDTYFQFSTVMDTLYTPAYGGTPPSSSTPPSSYHHNHHQHGLADALSTYQLASLFSILAMAALYDPNLDATCPEFKARRKLARALFFAPSTYAYSNSIAAAAAAASAASSQLPTTSNGSIRFTTPNNVETSKEGAHGSGGGMERHFSPGAASDALSSHTNATTSTVSGNSTSTGASGSAGAAGASSGLFGISIGANNWDWIRSPRTLEEMESLLLLFRTAWPFLDTSPMENYEFLSWGFKVACKLGLRE